MPSDTELTPTMRAAVELARKHGGKLSRWAGGFWIGAQEGNPFTCKSFGTSTVEALVKRGVAVYTRWKDRPGGGEPFPIEMTLLPAFGDTLNAEKP